MNEPEKAVSLGEAREMALKASRDAKELMEDAGAEDDNLEETCAELEDELQDARLELVKLTNERDALLRDFASASYQRNTWIQKGLGHREEIRRLRAQRDKARAWGKARLEEVQRLKMALSLIRRLSFPIGTEYGNDEIVRLVDRVLGGSV